MAIKFFGKVDHNQYGNISSQTPAWAAQPLIDELEESVRRKKAGIEMGTIPHDGIAQAKEEIRQTEKKLEDIYASKPKFSTEDENKLNKMRKDLADKIQDTMFTRSEMKLGLVDAHEEARRMADFIVKISVDQADVAKENNIRVVEKNGGIYVSRDGATQLWKLINKYFGEPSMVESLRRDKATARTGA